jgi:PAS domain S-box-containing protein
MVSGKQKRDPLQLALRHFRRISRYQTGEDTLIETFLTLCRRFTGCSAAGIRLLEADGGIPYRTTQGFTRGFRNAEDRISLDIGHSLYLKILRGVADGESPYHRGNDVYYLPSMAKYRAGMPLGRERIYKLFQRFGFQSVLVLPIRRHTSVMGFVVLAHQQADAFGEDQIAMLRQAVLELAAGILRTRGDVALKESARLYREIFTHASDAISLRDLEGNITEANPAACELTAYPPEELVGMNLSQLLTPEGIALSRERQQALLAGAPGPAHYVVDLIRKDGQRRVIESVSGLLRREGEPYGVIVMIRDITARKRMERRLLEREKTFRAMAEQSSDGILIADGDGKYVYANAGAGEITGYAEAELLEMHQTDLVHAREMPFLAERAEQRQRGVHLSRQFESTFVGKGGRLIPVEIVEAKTQWHDRDTVQTIFRDIGERKRLKSYVLEVTRALEEERKRIARELHDDTIQSLAALALDIQGVIKTSRAGGTAGDTAARLEDLRQRLSDVADGVRRYTYQLRPAVLDQMGLIAALEQITGEMQAESGVIGQLEVTGEERRLSAELELALFRIVQEALQNVRKHARARRVWVRVNFSETGVNLEVNDNGRGFQVPQIEDLTAQGKLGLLGMQERVSQFGGRLKVISQPGQGTTLSIEV